MSTARPAPRTVGSGPGPARPNVQGIRPRAGRREDQGMRAEPRSARILGDTYRVLGPRTKPLHLKASSPRRVVAASRPISDSMTYMKARHTQARLAIAVELLSNIGSVHWGYELSRRAGVGAGSMYPFLGELLEAGHLEDGWEDQRAAGRPPRRYYTVTPSGERFLRDFVSASPARGRPARSRPAPLGHPVAGS